jgi:metal-responsive CopG/Arc/MetJ family transcriptional regulator
MFGSGSKISLDGDLLRRCREHAKTAGYSSVEEFIQHALETTLRKSAAAPEDDPKVLERLKGLGYIE